MPGIPNDTDLLALELADTPSGCQHEDYGSDGYGGLACVECGATVEPA